MLSFEKHRRHIGERMAPDLSLMLAWVALQRDSELAAAQLFCNFSHKRHTRIFRAAGEEEQAELLVCGRCAALLQDGVHGPFQCRRRSLPLPCCYFTHSHSSLKRRIGEACAD